MLKLLLHQSTNLDIPLCYSIKLERKEVIFILKTLIKDDFIPLTDDILFKHIFGSSKNTKFIEDFLECYFNYPKGYLKNKVKVNSEALIDKLNYYDKNMRVSKNTRYVCQY